MHSSGRVDHRHARAQCGCRPAQGFGHEHRGSGEQDGEREGLMRAAILLVSLAFSAAAQQAPVAKQEVPDNIAPHAAPAQPLPYSHKTHVALGLECLRCYTNPDPGNGMTFPATTVCMTCHSTIAKEKPAIVKLAEFARSGQPISWQRVYQITPGVTWSHRKH